MDMKRNLYIFKLFTSSEIVILEIGSETNCQSVLLTEDRCDYFDLTSN